MQYLSTKLLIAFLLALPLGGKAQGGNGNKAKGECPPHQYEHTSASEVARAKCDEERIITPICSSPSDPCASDSESSSAATEASSQASQASTDSSATPASSTLLDLVSESTTIVDEDGCVCTCPASATPPASEGSSPASGSSSAPESSTQSGGCPTGATTSEPTCSCILEDELEKIKEKLPKEYQIIFELECIQKIKVIIYDDMEWCGCSEEEKIKLKIILIGKVVSEFCEEHEEIAALCMYEEIEEWGFLITLKYTGVACQAELQLSQLEVINSQTGECNLTKSIKDQCSNNECGGEGSSELILELCLEIEYACLRFEAAEYDFGRLLGLVKALIDMLIDDCAPCEEALFNCTLTDELTVGDFYYLCEYYYIEYQVLDCFSGSAEECPLVVTLEEAVYECQSATESSTAASSTPESSQSVCEEAALYVEELKSNFSQLSSEEERYDCFVASFPLLSFECQELFLYLVVVEVKIEITVGELQLIGCNCENGDACGNLSDGKPGESHKETCKVDNRNESSLVKTCDKHKASLSSSALKNHISTYINAIKNCVYDESKDLDEKLNCSCYYVCRYSTQNTTTNINLRKSFQGAEICSGLDNGDEDDEGSNSSDGSTSESSGDDCDADESGLLTVGDLCGCPCSQPQIDGGSCWVDSKCYGDSLEYDP